MFEVSVIVPVYNVENYLSRCVSSLLEQTACGIEYIFIDDCSSDRSYEILLQLISSYEARLARDGKVVRIMHLQSNHGVANVRNMGIDMASGEYITFVDSDDYVEPDMLAMMLQTIHGSSPEVVNVSSIFHYGRTEKVISHSDNACKEAQICSVLARREPSVLWGRLIKKAVITDNKIRCKDGVNVGEDMQILPIILYFASSVVSTDYVGYHHMVYENVNSYTNKFSEHNSCNERESLQIVNDFFKDKDSVYCDSLSVARAKLLSCQMLASNWYKVSDTFKSIINADYQDIPESAVSQLPSRYRVPYKLGMGFLLKLYSCFFYMLLNCRHWLFSR